MSTGGEAPPPPAQPPPQPSPPLPPRASAPPPSSPPPPARSAHALSYARPLSPGEQPARPRLSRLAVASIVLAAIACPCLDGTWEDLLTRASGGRIVPSGPAPAFILPALSLLVAIVAVLRIKRSHGHRRGMEWAAFALMLASIWITFMTVIAILI